MSLNDSGGEYIVSASKVAPPAAVSASLGYGLSLQDWVLIATLLYTVLQTAYLIYKFFKERRDGG